MHNKPTSRKQKIDLLNQLQSGRIAVQDIAPPAIEIWIGRQREGIYTRDFPKDLLQCTEAELDEYERKHPNTRFLVLQICESYAAPGDG